MRKNCGAATWGCPNNCEGLANDPKPDLSVWVSVTELLWALGGSAGMWDINRWSVSPPRPPLLASDTVGMEMLGMVNTLDTVANGDWVLVAESMTSCLMMAV